MSAAKMSALLLILVTSIAVWQRQKRPWLLVGWLWFLGTLVPIIGFVRFGHFYVGDRYAYIPSIGLALAVAVGMEQMIQPFLVRWAIGGVVLVLCALGTRADLPRWQNSFALYNAALKIGPHHVLFNNRGSACLQIGSKQDALADFDAAIRLYPNYAEAYANRGITRTDLGDFPEAIKDFEQALKLDPKSAVAHNGRGAAFLKMGDMPHAMSDFDRATQLKPDYAAALSNRGSLWLDIGNPQASIQDCTAAINSDATLGSAWNNRGNAYSRVGQYEEMLNDYDQSIKLSPSRAEYYNNRAAGYFLLKQFSLAKADLEKCRALGGQPHPGLVHDLEAAITATTE